MSEEKQNEMPQEQEQNFAELERRLRDKISHKESVILDKQSALEKASTELSLYREIVEAQVKELRSGVDESIVKDLQDLPLARQLSLLRKVKDLGRVAEQPSPKPEAEEPVSHTPTVPKVSMTDMASQFQQELETIKRNPQATLRDYQMLREKYKGKI